MSITVLAHVLGHFPAYLHCAGYLPRGWHCVLMRGPAGPQWEGANKAAFALVRGRAS